MDSGAFDGPKVLGVRKPRLTLWNDPADRSLGREEKNQIKLVQLPHSRGQEANTVEEAAEMIFQRRDKGPFTYDIFTGRGGSPKADVVREFAWIL